MEGLFTIFVIVMMIVKIVGKTKKKSGAARGPVKKVAAGEFVRQLDTWFEQQNTSAGSAATQSVQQAPLQSTPVRAVDRKAELMAKYGDKLPRSGSFEGFSRPLQPSEELAAGRAPGSLAFHSDEGKDVCDPTLGHGESSLDMTGIPVFAHHKEEEPLFTAQDMVRGFVMSEIFTRPGENRWKR